MKKLLKARTAKILSILSIFTISSLPMWAHTNSDVNNTVNSELGAGSIIGFTALIIALVILFAAKGATKVTTQK